MIKLELSIEEVNGILAALGELPTKSNAMFLIQKIQDQAIPQVPQEATETPNADAAGQGTTQE